MYIYITYIYVFSIKGEKIYLFLLTVSEGFQVFMAGRKCGETGTAILSLVLEVYSRCISCGSGLGDNKDFILRKRQQQQTLITIAAVKWV